MRRYLLTGLVIVGCALLLIALAEALFEQQTQANVVETAAPSIEVRARFTNVARAGQTTGFAVAPDGSLAIVDRAQQRVVRLTAAGRLLAEWGPRFEPDADARDLNGIAAAGSDWYLLDRGRSRILQLDSTGHATHTIDLLSLGTFDPNGLAVDPLGDIYLTDTGGNRILVLSPDGALVRTIGTAGTGLGQLKRPMALSFGPDGGVFVTDFDNGRVEHWDAGLQPINAWSIPGHVWGIAVDPLGRVFVPDADHNLVRMFNQQGDLVAEIGSQPGAPLGIDSPSQVGLVPGGDALWVLGNEALARVDLSVYGQIVPVTTSRGSPMPLAAAGALLVALGLAPSAWRRIKLPRPLGEGGDERPAPARPDPSPRDDPSPAPRSASPRGRDVLLATRNARLALAAGVSLFTLGIGGVVLAQIALALASPTARNAPWPTLALEVAAGLAWAIGCAISARALPILWVTEWPATREAPSRYPALSRPRAVVIAAAIGLGGLAGGLWYLGRFETQEATRVLLLWSFALVLAGLACSTIQPVRRPSLLTLIPLLLFLVALAPRLWQAADLPYGIWYDEAQGAVEVRRVTMQATYTPVLNMYGKDTSGFYYVISGLALFVGDGVLASRAAAALVGALTAPATYWLGRELFGWRVGLAAGGVLAFLRWHLNFSRLGFNPISLPLCATLAFWLLARAVRRKNWSDLAWAGLALGVGLHGYTGFRGMPLVALVALVGAARLYRWPARSLLLRVGGYLGAAALTALPVIVFAAQDPVAFNGRIAQTLIMTQPLTDTEKLRQIWDNLQRHALMFNVSGDLNGRHNLPGAPMLDPLTAGLAVLGLGWLLVRPRDWRTLLLVVWAAVAMSGGILTLAFEAPQALRTLGVTPVLALLAGLGIVASLDRLVALLTIPRRVSAWPASVAVGTVGALTLGWIGFTNLDVYFNRQMPNADVFAAFSTRETVPARAALEAAASYPSILASTTMTPSVEAAFLVPDLQANIRPFDPAGDLPFRGQGPSLVFLETEHDQALADDVARMYPDAVQQPIQAPGGGQPIVDAFRLDAGVLSAHRGVQATYRGADGAQVVRTEVRPEFGPRLNSAPVALPAEVTWQGGLALDSTGDYGFRAPLGFELRIDDALLGSAASPGGRVRLARGNHAVTMSGSIQPGLSAGLEWLPPGITQWQPISAQAMFLAPAGGLGLQLTLTPGLDPISQPKEQYVDPVLSHYFHLSPFARIHLDPRAWTADWLGQLDAPDSGTYVFGLDHSQAASVWIDDRQVLGNLNGLAGAPTMTSLELASGRHAIRVRYEKTTDDPPWINLYWTPPGSPTSIVPGSALYAPPPVVLGPAQ